MQGETKQVLLILLSADLTWNFSNFQKVVKKASLPKFTNPKSCLLGLWVFVMICDLSNKKK